MNENLKQRMWLGLGVATIVFCLPIGLYTAYQGIKMEKCLRIGDLEEFESRKGKIKTAWLIILACYVVMIILKYLGVFD